LTIGCIDAKLLDKIEWTVKRGVVPLDTLTKQPTEGLSILVTGSLLTVKLNK
jgi:hypothetical protein